MILQASHRTRHLVTGRRPREGFALFMALGALVIIGVLVAGSSFISFQETRLGQNSLLETKAFTVAEYGLNKIQADWDRTPNLQMANGAKFDTSYTLAGQGTATVRYVRLNNETFWIVSEGRAALGSSASRVAVKRVGAVLRLRIPTIKANGAVTTGGNLTTSGNVEVVGTNTIPPSWTGCAASGSPDTLSKAGLVATPDATITIGATKHVVGDPILERDELAADSTTYVTFGDETYKTLTTTAIPVSAGTHGSDIGPSVAAGVCDKANVNNWGEPWRSGTGYKAECVNYFPIIHVAGNLHLNGNGRGQGILLIDGNFQVNGTFEFYGLIVAGGTLTAGSGTAKIFGAIMAASGELDTSSLGGTVDIKYSQCGLERAMRGSAQVVQARDRSWVELY